MYIFNKGSDQRRIAVLCYQFFTFETKSGFYHNLWICFVTVSSTIRLTGNESP